MCDIMCNLKCKTMEQVEKRIIVVDTTTNEKYVFPNRSEAALAIGGTSENIRKRLINGSDTLLYQKYKVYHYTEEKYWELNDKGVEDGSIIDFLEHYFNKCSRCLYR